MRRSKRCKRARIIFLDQDHGGLQLDLQSCATGSALHRGIRKMSKIIENASDGAINSLHLREWSPLVGAIFICGSRTTNTGNSRRDLEGALVELVKMCQRRGINVDYGARRSGGGLCEGSLHRPLVLSAYYGLADAVSALLDAGATPDMADGHGRTAFMTSLQNPTGRSSLFRACDRKVAELLILRGVVTFDIKRWRETPRGGVMYMNANAVGGSSMAAAIVDKNVAVVEFLKCHGAVVTDHDFLSIRADRKARKEIRRLLPIVVEIANSESGSDGHWNINRVASWAPEIDWSFPTTWRLTVALTQKFNLPKEVFLELIRFFPRDWFYSSSQLTGNLSSLLGASLGPMDISARRLRWLNR